MGLPPDRDTKEAEEAPPPARRQPVFQSFCSGGTPAAVNYDPGGVGEEEHCARGVRRQEEARRRRRERQQNQAKGGIARDQEETPRSVQERRQQPGSVRPPQSCLQTETFDREGQGRVLASSPPLPRFLLSRRGREEMRSLLNSGHPPPAGGVVNRGDSPAPSSLRLQHVSHLQPFPPAVGSASPERGSFVTLSRPLIILSLSCTYHSRRFSFRSLSTSLSLSLLSLYLSACLSLRSFLHPLQCLDPSNIALPLISRLLHSSLPFFLRLSSLHRPSSRPILPPSSASRSPLFPSSRLLLSTPLLPLCPSTSLASLPLSLIPVPPRSSGPRFLASLALRQSLFCWPASLRALLPSVFSPLAVLRCDLLSLPTSSLLLRCSFASSSLAFSPFTSLPSELVSSLLLSPSTSFLLTGFLLSSLLALPCSSASFPLSSFLSPLALPLLPLSSPAVPSFLSPSASAPPSLPPLPPFLPSFLSLPPPFLLSSYSLSSSLPLPPSLPFRLSSPPVPFPLCLSLPPFLLLALGLSPLLSILCYLSHLSSSRLSLPSPIPSSPASPSSPPVCHLPFLSSPLDRLLLPPSASSLVARLPPRLPPSFFCLVLSPSVPPFLVPPPSIPLLFILDPSIRSMFFTSLVRHSS
ncbi:hypothetical protein C7M84_025368 [Penaeus vannamei]|uniref:Uncharacterized protein n=1 Tax=Penaeus vannamei TaxID=6689 RepID=A0A423TYC6_PENVA|nr:hypothetical protein C7M84_025368 [Penaeus vannamei]